MRKQLYPTKQKDGGRRQTAGANFRLSPAAERLQIFRKWWEHDFDDGCAERNRFAYADEPGDRGIRLAAGERPAGTGGNAHVRTHKLSWTLVRDIYERLREIQGKNIGEMEEDLWMEKIAGIGVIELRCMTDVEGRKN